MKGSKLLTVLAALAAVAVIALGVMILTGGQKTGTDALTAELAALEEQLKSAEESIGSVTEDSAAIKTAQEEAAKQAEEAAARAAEEAAAARAAEEAAAAKAAEEAAAKAAKAAEEAAAAKAAEEAAGNKPVQTEGITIPVITGMDKFDIPANDAMAFIRDMKIGWNLGNTFDAFDGYTKHASGIGMETSWVGAKTSKKLITAIKEAGFNSIRIPVSWHNHVDGNDVIDEDWMARVRQVADMALEMDMYVIVNVHHDNDQRYFYPDSAHYERSAAYLKSVWTQMAEAFRDCGDHLILESLNEPRLVGTSNEWYWDPNSAACKDAADCINRLNQLFVDTVRATGGNNADRYLLVPAYDASPWYAVNQAFQLPKDTADNRLIVEAHAYTPYDYALNVNKPNDRTFDLEKDKAKQKDITDFMNELYKRFVSAGVPVLIDEFGALNKNGNTQDRVNFTAFYVAAASSRGITCVWWDNHSFGSGEQFGLINRGYAKWVYPDIVLAMTENCLCNR